MKRKLLSLLLIASFAFTLGMGIDYEVKAAKTLTSTNVVALSNDPGGGGH
jgi:hypothetical protein